MDIPVTTAVRALRAAKVEFEPCFYDYQDHGGTERAAQELNIPEHQTIKTIVLENEDKKPLIVLMHGDREISLKQLARHLHVKTITPCSPETANRHTGYMVGGTSPFGTRKALPIYAEATIFDLPALYINGGKRGFLVKITPAVLEALLAPQRVAVAIGN